jgi:DNA helicase-2/ATP-dependent DNA helicase PcrA
MTRKFTPTEEQIKILSLQKGTHLVLAPPGSGKTELLANRVMKAKESGLDDREIICLTFTNRAAKGMQGRIEVAYPENEFIIGNIHYFCLMFLMKNNLLPINAEALDEEEAVQLIEEIKNGLKYNEKVHPNKLLLLATYIKQKALVLPKELLPRFKRNEFSDPWKAKAICDAYIKEKEENKYVDFDDLLTLAYHHLSNDKNKELELSNFKWLQVDEVQDLNPLQWAIIREITSKDALSVYFGDYDQAIFSFMGAELGSLSKIKETVETNNQNEIHFLSKNFRAPSYMLDVYTKYAQTNWQPTWKTFPTPAVIKSTPKHALVMIKVNGSKEKEFQLITNKVIPSLIGNDETTAIIVRYNGSADTIGQYLKEQHISFFQVSGFDLFRKKKVKALMAFFSTFLNSNDRIAWTRLFFEYNIFTTLKESRNFINQLFKSGLTPIDILEYEGESSKLIDFFDVFSNREMIVFDTETTGLNTEQDDIIQIAAVRIKNGKIAAVFEVFMNTEKDITETEKVHKIS